MRNDDRDLLYVIRRRGELRPYRNARMRRHIRDLRAADALALGVTRDEVLLLPNGIDELHRTDAAVIADLVIGIGEVVPKRHRLVAVVYEGHLQRDGAA